MPGFRDLKVWIRAKDLAISVYKLSAQECFDRDWGLRDQMRRSAVSIASNISEGHESGSNSNSARYFNIAKGSAAELLTQATIAFEIGYWNTEAFTQIERECLSISAMLEKLIQARTKN
jgi:four helix bundle protein